MSTKRQRPPPPAAAERTYVVHPTVDAEYIMSMPRKTRQALTVGEDRCPRGKIRLRIFRYPNKFERFLVVPSSKTVDGQGLSGPFWLENLHDRVPLTLRCPCCPAESVQVADIIERHRRIHRKH